MRQVLANGADTFFQEDSEDAVIKYMDDCDGVDNFRYFGVEPNPGVELMPLQKSGLICSDG